MFRLITNAGVEVRRSTSFDLLMKFVGYLDAKIQILTSAGWEDTE